MKGPPIQTFFYLPTFLEGVSFTLELGAHTPYPTESQVPFLHDTAQRIIALDVSSYSCRLVIRVGAFLDLIKGREVTKIRWNEWKHHAVFTSIDVENLTIQAVQVSGCWLFCIYSTGSGSDFQMEMYDFSMKGRTKHLKRLTSGDLGVVNCLSSTGAKAKIPWDALAGRGTHHSIVLFYVSITVPSSPALE